MATVSAYPNGFTMGRGSGKTRVKGDGIKRGRITGWTATAVRNHSKFLYAVHTPRLTGEGAAFTLTLRDCPPNAQEWERVRRNFAARMYRMGAIRLHWVVEWQRRGVPHLHGAVYFETMTAADMARIRRHWREAAAAYGPGEHSQVVKRIDGPTGWLQYLSKHSARGVNHYQRQGRPEGWETTGRLWGASGDWPVVQSARADLTDAEFYRLRRLYKRWRIEQAREALAQATTEAERVAAQRRIEIAKALYTHEKESVRRSIGVSDWCDFEWLMQALGKVTAESYERSQSLNGVRGRESVLARQEELADMVERAARLRGKRWGFGESSE